MEGDTLKSTVYKIEQYANDKNLTNHYWEKNTEEANNHGNIGNNGDPTHLADGTKQRQKGVYWQPWKDQQHQRRRWGAKSVTKKVKVKVTDNKDYNNLKQHILEYCCITGIKVISQWVKNKTIAYQNQKPTKD